MMDAPGQWVALLYVVLQGPSLLQAYVFTISWGPIFSDIQLVEGEIKHRGGLSLFLKVTHLPSAHIPLWQLVTWPQWIARVARNYILPAYQEVKETEFWWTVSVLRYTNSELILWTSYQCSHEVCLLYPAGSAYRKIPEAPCKGLIRLNFPADSHIIPSYPSLFLSPFLYPPYSRPSGSGLLSALHILQVRVSKIWAHRTNPACCLLWCGLGAKNGFHIFKWLKKNLKKSNIA